MTRACPRCGHRTAASNCCGIDLSAGRGWRMTPERIKAVRAIAHGHKGLDNDTYRLYLSRVGAQHTTELTREQFNDLLKGLARLPNVPRFERAGQGSAAA